ncbi:MAG: hypothetical protein ABIP51_20615 [Bacteroidia bacterium]
MSENNEIRKFNEVDAEKRRINEAIVKKNPNLGLIDERIVYDKKFLLEVQAAGYNPLDKEDVNNFLQSQPPKNQERNIILSGGNTYKYLGQGEYEEDDLQKYMKKTGASTSVKKPTDVYASDFKGSEREFLLEKVKENEVDLSDVVLDPFSSPKYKNYEEAENTLRKNMAKVFGSDDIDIKRTDIPKVSNQPSRQNDNIDKTLELIKELKALGFTPNEIKQEIQLRNR